MRTTPDFLRHGEPSGSLHAIYLIYYSSYSTSASTTAEQEEPGQQEKPGQQEQKELYDRIRVEHLRNRLKEVNRRVAASPIGQGREPLVDRVLVEDKLGALSARMDFLASEMHDRIYHTPATPDVAAVPAPTTTETPTRVTAQTLIDVLLDLLPIDPGCVPQSNSPPVQLRQYVRYVQAAGKYAAVARAESLLLSNSTRSAIGEETETSTSTRGSDSTINEVRALLWRALMIKRGMQRVIQAGIATPAELSSMAWAVKLVLRYLTYARECIEDLEARGPKSEDARALFEEVEQTTEGLVLLELRKWTEKRIKAGTAWERVDNEIVKLCGDKTNQPRGEKESMCEFCVCIIVTVALTLVAGSKLRPIYVRLRKVETLQPPPPRLDVRPDGSTGTTGPHYRWRAKSIGRPLKLLKVMYQYILSFCDTLDRLALLVCEDAKKAAILREAKAAIDLPEEVGQAMSDHLFRKAGPATCHQWAYVLNNQRQTVDKIKFQLRATDAHLRLFRVAMLEDGEQQSQEIREAFYDARLELMIAYDVIWRTSNRLAQDAEKMLEMGEELNDGSWKEPQRERISSR